MAQAKQTRRRARKRQLRSTTNRWERNGLLDYHARVYFVFAEAAGTVKIGTTADLETRLTALRAMSPCALTLLGTIAGGSSVEHWFHDQARSDRSHFEWFHWTPAVVALIDRALKLGDLAAEVLCPEDLVNDRSAETDWNPGRVAR